MSFFVKFDFTIIVYTIQFSFFFEKIEINTKINDVKTHEKHIL